MRWGENAFEFLRPIHWMVCIHGKTPIEVSLFGIKSGNQSQGHRFHLPKSFTIQSADTYVNELRENQVMVDQRERLAHIQEAIHKIAHQHNGQAIVEPELLDQVCGLVEWPVPLYAHFDRAFLEVPQEALISSMQIIKSAFLFKIRSANYYPLLF